LTCVAEELLRTHPDEVRWAMRDEGVWSYLTPCDVPRRGQGWKMHV
jgi:hypothetical protein